MLSWSIYPTESFIACVFHCMITTLSVLLIYHWKSLIKLTSKEMIEKIMTKYRINKLFLGTKYLVMLLYITGIILEAISYYLRYVLDRTFPFMELFKIGFLCFYIIDVCTIVYFLVILFYLRRELNDEKIN